MVLVELKTSNDGLLRNIKQRNYQRAFGSSYNCKSISNVLVFVLTLLTQENVRKRLLDVLEIEYDSVTFSQHLMDQVSF